MIKKLFVTAAAAAAVSVPLAGAAWADPPSDPGPSSPGTPSGNGIGQGGVPKTAGSYFDAVSTGQPRLTEPEPERVRRPDRSRHGVLDRRKAARQHSRCPWGFREYDLRGLWHTRIGWSCQDHIWENSSRVSHEDFHTWVPQRSYGNRPRNQRRGVRLPLKSAVRVPPAPRSCGAGGRQSLGRYSRSTANSGRAGHGQTR